MKNKLILILFFLTFLFGNFPSFAIKKANSRLDKDLRSYKVEKKIPIKKSRREKFRQGGKRLASNKVKPKIIAANTKKNIEKKNIFERILSGKTRLSKEEINKRAAAKKKALDMKKADRMARKAEWRAERLKRKMEAEYQRQMRKEELVAEKEMQKEARQKAMQKWKKIRMAEIEQDYQDGMHADLYRRPDWPFYMLFADNKNLMQIEGGFEHATNFYNSEGSTQDLSASIFGEQDFTFRDILLALDLSNKTIGGNTILQGRADFPWESLDHDDYGLYNNRLIFFSESNKLDLNFNYGRYIKDKNVFIGFELPIGYKQIRLKFDTDVVPGNNNNDAASVDQVYLRSFQREIFDYVLRAKDLYYQPKSSLVGIGDFATLINFEPKTKYVDKLKLGGKIIFPTAKQAPSHKLWAPELGKGFTQFKVFSAVMFNKQSSSFNPHMFAEFTYLWAGHKNKRVPRVVTYDGNSNRDIVGASTMAHGDNVNYRDIPFSEPDSKIIAFADNARSIKIRSGAEFNVRLGNIWEKFIDRRGFLDVYYDFRAKLKDRVLNSNLDESIWQVHRLEENTMEIEHKACFDFSYQFDIHTRMNFGATYVFAGINVPDTFRANLGVMVEF